MSHSAPSTSQVLQSLQQQHWMQGRFPALNLVRAHWTTRYAARYTFVFLVLAIIAMIFVPWQQTSKGYGRVIALDPQQRPQPVTASAKGIVVKIQEGLREGAFVKKGDVVLEIEPLAKDAQLQIQNQIEQLNSKLKVAENKRDLAAQSVDLQKLAGQAILDSAKESVEAAKAKVEQTKDKVQGFDASVERSKADFDRAAKLLADGLKSQKDFIKEKENYLKAVATFEEGEGAVIEAMKFLASKEQDLLGKTREIEVKNRETEGKLQEALSDIATIQKELSETRQKASEYGDRLLVTSPVDGFLHELHAQTGSTVIKEGDTLFIVVPQTKDLAVELMIRGNDVPLLHIGDEVRIQFEGYPAIQFLGWPSAARGTFGGRIALISPTDDGMGNFRILVTPDDDAIKDKREESWPDFRYLRQGGLANGWVLLSKDGKLSRVSLGYEIWRQLNGFPPVTSSKKPSDSGKEKEDKPSKIKLPK